MLCSLELGKLMLTCVHASPRNTCVFAGIEQSELIAYLAQLPESEAMQKIQQHLSCSMECF